MGDKEKIWVTPTLPGGVRIRHIGFLDLGEFYRRLQMWLSFKEFFQKNNLEEYYMETELADGSKKIEFRWHATKKRNEYITFHIVINAVLIGIQKVEVQQPDGTKMKMEKGDFDFRMEAYLEKTESDHGFLKKIYEKYIIDRRLEEYQVNIYETFYSLVDFMNSYFSQYVKT